MPELQRFPSPKALSSRRKPVVISPELDYSAIERLILANLRASTSCPKSLSLMGDFHFSDFYGPDTCPRLSSVEVEQAKYLDMSERFLELAEERQRHEFLRFGMKTPVFILASVISV